MTADAVFARRVVRLAITSAAALAVLWSLAEVTVPAHSMFRYSLAVGWLLMPLLLLLSLRRPRLRYALIVPATLVTIALLGISAAARTEDVLASTGWLLITGGVVVGGLEGFWFWFRWMPVPRSLMDPFSRGRWLLVGLHVSLIVTGLGLVGISSFRSPHGREVGGSIPDLLRDQHNAEAVASLRRSSLATPERASDT